MEIPVELYYPNTSQSKHYLSELQKETGYVDKALKQRRRIRVGCLQK